MFMEEKVYKNVSELISIQSNRGLNIVNDAETIKKINFLSYYGIFNRYKDPFIDRKSKGEKYIKGTSFAEIYELYKFDQKIRSIIFEYILMIESNIKSIIANEFSKEYGHKNYLLIENFNNVVHKNSRTTLEERKGKILALISYIQQETSKRLIDKNFMITHYLTKHGYVPLWVLVNILTFGTISKFYYLMKEKDKNAVSRYYNIKPDQFESIIKVITEFRNACAHNERIYSLRVYNKDNKPKYIPDLNAHALLGILKDKNGNYVCGKNDLFSVIIVFKHFLDNNDFVSFYNSFIIECNSFEKCLKTIKMDDIYKIMGFPNNWEKIKEI